MIDPFFQAIKEINYETLYVCDSSWNDVDD